jgi:hypothetical protein
MNAMRDKFRFSDVLLTALVPASLFLAAYVYEYGFFSYFNVPSQFIRLDWTTALGAIFDSWQSWWPEGLFGASILLSLGSSTSILTDGEFFKQRGLFFALLFFNVFVFHLLIGSVLFTIDFIVLAILYEQVRRLRKKGSTSAVDATRKFVHASDWLTLTLGRRQSVNLFTAVLLLIISYDAGWNTAQTQGWYFVRNDGLELALIINTGDTLIYSPIHEADRKDCSGADPCYLRTDSLLVEKLSENHGVIRLDRQFLGSLREHSRAWLNSAPLWESALFSAIRHN